MVSKGKNSKLTYMVIADFAFPGENGKPGIIGIFDTLGVPNFPAQHPELFVVANIKGSENSEHEVALELEDPSGNNLLLPNSPKIKVHLSGTGSGNVVHRFFNLSFKQVGLHKFVLSVDGEKVGQAELQVLKITRQASNERNNPN